MTVWAEGVFLLNAGLDLGLLAGAGRLLGGPLRRRLLRAVAGGGGRALGGALALLALLPVPALSGLPGRTLGLVLLTACAYGVSLDALRQGVLFLGLSLALCGVQAALAELFAWGAVLFRGGVLLPVSWRSLAVSAALLYGACAALSGAVRERKRLLLRTQATAAGRTVSFRSLADTGSFLRDPLTGRPVLARARPELQPRLIPFCTVGTERGLLLGVRCQELLVGRERRSGGILAFAPGEVSEDGSYHGLTGG